jgi:hypothetical protein
LRAGADASVAACGRALRIELAQPVQGERWAGAVAQQTLTPGTVFGLDARRIVST